MKDDADSWIPALEMPPGRHFKWAFDCDTSTFAIWEVGRVGDGIPSHDMYLREAWGRSPGTPRDRLGAAIVDDDVVSFVVYYHAQLPLEAEQWARATFPRHEIATHRVGVSE